jgi:hypothetical protein
MNLLYYQIKNEQDLNIYLSKVDLFKKKYPYYKIVASNLNELKQEQLCYFTLELKGEVIVLMPFRIREIDFKIGDETYFDIISPYGYSGPLFDKNLSRAYLIKFWEFVDQWYESHNVVSEFVRFSLNHNYQFYSGKLIPTLSNVKGYIFPNEKEQWVGFKSKVRNNYRKAIANNLRFEINQDCHSVKYIEKFYSVYLDTMKRIGANAEYFYSLNYFKNIIERNAANYAFAFVYKDDKLISVELIFILDKTIYSYLGGTLSEYFKVRPNDFLKIEVINWARSKGYEYYILGGGRKDDDNLYHYKKSYFPNDPDILFYTGRKVINVEIYKALDKLANGNNTEVRPSRKPLSNRAYFPVYRKP